MILRVFAVLAAFVVPLLLAIDAVASLLPELVWLGPAIAAVFALPVVFVAKHARGQALVGAGLAAMASFASPEVPQLLTITGDPQAVHDLRERPLPPARHGSYVAVRGFLRSDWQVDEYRVAAGQRPDQNEAAKAVLVPVLGTDAAIIQAKHGALERVIVARIPPAQLDAGPLVTLRGRLQAVDPSIVDSLFAVQVDGEGHASASTLRPEAVMLDTFTFPTRGQAITRLGLAIGASVLSLIMLLFALPSLSPVKPRRLRWPRRRR